MKIKARILQMFMDDIIAISANLMRVLHIVIVHEAIGRDAVHEIDHRGSCRSFATIQPVVAKYAFKLGEQSCQIGNLEVACAGIELVDRNLFVTLTPLDERVKFECVKGVGECQFGRVKFVASVVKSAISFLKSHSSGEKILSELCERCGIPRLP